MNFLKQKMRLTRNSFKSRDLKYIDFSLILLVLILVCLGLIFLYSASSIYADKKGLGSFFYVKRQAMWVLLGLSFTALVARIDLKKTRVLIKPAVILTLILLAVTLYLPPIANVHRWISLGFMKLQMSEFAKIVLVLYLADFFDRKHSCIVLDRKQLLKPLGVMGVMLVLIAREPDLGTPALLFVITLVLFFSAGVRLKPIFMLLLAMLPVFIYELFRYPYRIARIKVLLDPCADAAGAGYNLCQAQLAVGSGGWLGRGFGASQIKLMYLPELHTDFIFPIIAEEMGLIRCFLILLLFVALLIKGVRSARNAETFYTTLVAMGLTLMISLQAFFNIAMTIGLIPTKGLPLPFFSYGGSSILATLISVGIILNISAHRRGGEKR